MKSPNLSRLFAYPSTYVGSAVKVEGIPNLPLNQPEIAFMGRSNCGKSSLINALLGTTKLVKTAKRPGHTAMLNFFVVGGSLTMTDMPGYGFGSRPEWGSMIIDYLSRREQLRRVCLLVDSRRGLLPIDYDTINILEQGRISYWVVLTKIDKIKEDRVKSLCETISAELSKPRQSTWTSPVFAVSAFKKMGISDLQKSILDLCFPR